MSRKRPRGKTKHKECGEEQSNVELEEWSTWLEQFGKMDNSTRDCMVSGIEEECHLRPEQID